MEIDNKTKINTAELMNFFRMQRGLSKKDNNYLKRVFKEITINMDFLNKRNKQTLKNIVENNLTDKELERIIKKRKGVL